MEATAVARNLTDIRGELARAARAAGRQPEAVTLIAVSKTQAQERIEAALASGQRVFGENYVQEAQRHWAGARERWADLELHLIGPLQTNKAKDAVALFDVIQTLDREKLAAALAAAEAKQGLRRRHFVQVNTGEEPQKGGIAPTEALAFAKRCREVHGLDVVGLMAIPPFDEPPAPHFALLRRLGEAAGLAGLSMGMSADYADAVRLGATHVRIGTAIFGERPAKQGA